MSGFRAYSPLMAVFPCLIVACVQGGYVQEADNGSVISMVTVEDDVENVLRKYVSVDLSKPSSIMLEYWKQGDDGRRNVLSSSSVSSRHEMKLVILEADAEYLMKVSTSGGDEETVMFRTGELPDGMLETTDLMPDYSYAFDGLVHIADKASGTLYLINDKGKTVWYEPTDGKSVICSNYDSRSKSFQAIVGFNPDENFTGEYILVVDIYGNVLMKKYHYELDNPYFHHDVIMLPDGNIAVVNQVREEFDLRHAGGSESETVAGDGITVMDLDGNTLWTWSAFEVMSPEDDPDIMVRDPEFQYAGNQDWLHANSLCVDADGNFYISFNKLSQIWKISPEGELIYRLGKDGDISIDDPDSFTDRQHSISVTGPGRLMVFDNGYSAKKSRAIEYEIDGSGRTAKTLVKYNIIADDFSPNQSSVYRIGSHDMIYASTVAQNIAVTDINGNLKWRYHSSAPIFRAIYIDDIIDDNNDI